MKILILFLFVFLSPKLLAQGTNAQSRNYFKEFQIRTLSPKDAAEEQALKVKWQKNLEKVSHRKFLCSLPPQNCIQVYQRLAFFDWKNSKIPNDETFFISPSSKAIEDKRDLIYLPASTDSEALKKYYGIQENCNNQQLGDSLIYAEKLYLDDLRSWGGIVAYMGKEKLKKADETLCPGQEDFYTNLFLGGEFNATIAFGYRDQYQDGGYNRVDLNYAKNLYGSQLNSLIKMGFTQKEKTATTSTLEKIFIYKNQRMKARVKLIMSTIACPNETGAIARRTNMNEVCEEQKQATQKAKETFLKALQNDQLVIYSGHSRHGKGPDFGPNFSDVGKVPVRAGLLESIPMKDQAKILYFNSCSSKEHFSKAVKDKANSTNHPLELIANDVESDSASSPAANTAVVMSILEGACPEDIKTLINANKTFNDHSKASVKQY